MKKRSERKKKDTERHSKISSREASNCFQVRKTMLLELVGLELGLLQTKSSWWLLLLIMELVGGDKPKKKTDHS